MYLLTELPDSGLDLAGPGGLAGHLQGQPTGVASAASGVTGCEETVTTRPSMEQAGNDNNGIIHDRIGHGHDHQAQQGGGEHTPDNCNRHGGTERPGRAQPQGGGNHAQDDG